MGLYRLKTSRRTDVIFWSTRPRSGSMRQQEDLAAIREGIADMESGRILTLDELDARIRARLDESSKA